MPDKLDRAQLTRYSPPESEPRAWPNQPTPTKVVHYSRAPVTEAVIDLHVSFDTPPAFSDLKKLAQALGQQFPLVHRIDSFAVNFAAQAGTDEVESAASASPLGLRLSSEKNDRILQARTQGLAYSHMPPYTQWEEFLGELRPLWTRYAEMFGVREVTRAAVRYINRLQVRSGDDIDAYLNIGARIPAEVSKSVIGYFSQIVVPVGDLGPTYKAIVNTGVEPGGGRDTAGLLLDIDVFCERPIAAWGMELWEILELLRGHKNRIFEASITDKVREMIR